MIRVDEVSKQFGAQPAVRDVSFTVAEGETLVLLGTSGCGKTTTLKLLNRLLDADSGTIEIDGVDVRRYVPHELRRQIGYVIQETGLFPHHTVAEAIATVPRLLGWKKTSIRDRSHDLLRRLQLPETLLDRYPHELSGGQRQRVGLARALAARPRMLLMDEPFGALDPITRATIRREFRALEEGRRTTTVLVTHDVTEAFELGDRVGLMDAGRLVQLGPPRDLLLRPANDFVKKFFSEAWLPLALRTLTPTDLRLTGSTLPPETSLETALTQVSPEGAAALWSALTTLRPSTP
jgi:osmoprotectant transport system ATP-binding protein